MKAKSNYISPEQMKKVYETVPDLGIRKWKDEDVIMLFKIAYWLDLRMGEAIPLQAEDFDLIRNECYLGKTKNEKAAYAVIPPQFKDELQLWLLEKKGFLWPQLNYYTVYHWLKRLGKMLDITAWTSSQEETGEKTITHVFRKSMAKDMLYGDNGLKKAPLNVISKQLRHKGRYALASTQEYLKLNTEDVKEWFNQDQVKEEREL